MNLTRFLTTGFGSGLAPKAPGTFGSIAAAIIWLGMSPFLITIQYRVLFAIMVSVLGLVTVHADLKSRNLDTTHPDPKEIVIDEWAGLFVTYSISPSQHWIFLLAGFVLFRVFDISKLGPVGRAESLPGTWGIMLDDIMAGIIAGLILFLCSPLGVHLSS